MRILTVNGIRSTGKESTDRLHHPLRAFGYEVVDVNQPVRSTWGARWKAKEDAQQIVDMSEEGDILAAHSYGGLKAAIANVTVNYLALFLYRPAMSRNYKFAEQDTKIFCVYSKDDHTILLGSLLRFNHPFGAAGRSGFKSPNVKNVKSRGSHSNDFKGINAVNWATFMHQNIQYLTRNV